MMGIADQQPIYGKRGFEEWIKLKLHDKLNTSLNPGKHLGLFSERYFLGGMDGGEVKHAQHMTVELVTPMGSQ